MDNTVKFLYGIKESIANLVHEKNGDKQMEQLAVLGNNLLLMSEMLFKTKYDSYGKIFSLFSKIIDNCANIELARENREALQSSFNVCTASVNELCNILFPKQCNCCGNQVDFKPISDYYAQLERQYGIPEIHYETLNTEEYTCPLCGATDRDRLIIHFLRKIQLPEAEENLSVLQIAPSQAISYWISAYCPHLKYDTADLYMEGVTYRADIQDMNMIKDHTYDVVICSHVLEHVKDDRKALEELRRIMKEDGILILLVPISLDDTGVDEAWNLSEIENLRRFGQIDHCRKYGKDGFLQRLYDTGMSVHCLDKTYFGEEILWRSGVAESSVLYVLTRTNDVILDRKKPIDIPEEIFHEGPLVSVIMSAYNHESYVSEAIQSVISQTYENFEFIVADDGSSDNTQEVMKEYSASFKEEYYFQNNTGNRDVFLASRATGKYIAVMNSDDLWDKDKLALEVLYMEKHPEVTACFTWCSYIENSIYDTTFYQKNREKEEWLRRFWEKGNCLCHPSILIRREKYVQLCSIGNACRQLPDFFKWVRLVQRDNIYVMPRILVWMRRHGNNTSTPNQDNRIRGHMELAANWSAAFNDMEDEVFLKVFRPELLDKNISHSQIQCEKYFLLLNTEDVCMEAAALFYFTQLDDNPEIRECFENIYDYYGRRDFAEDVLKKGYGELLRHYLK